MSTELDELERLAREALSIGTGAPTASGWDTYDEARKDLNNKANPATILRLCDDRRRERAELEAARERVRELEGALLVREHSLRTLMTCRCEVDWTARGLHEKHCIADEGWLDPVTAQDIDDARKALKEG